MTAPLRHKTGLSLVEVLVAAAIMGTIGLFIAQQVRNNSDEVGAQRWEQRGTELYYDVQRSFANVASCRSNLSGVNITTATNLSVPIPLTQITGDGRTLATISTATGSGSEATDVENATRIELIVDPSVAPELRTAVAPDGTAHDVRSYLAWIEIDSRFPSRPLRTTRVPVELAHDSTTGDLVSCSSSPLPKLARMPLKTCNPGEYVSGIDPNAADPNDRVICTAYTAPLTFRQCFSMIMPHNQQNPAAPLTLNKPLRCHGTYAGNTMAKTGFPCTTPWLRCEWNGSAWQARAIAGSHAGSITVCSGDRMGTSGVEVEACTPGLNPLIQYALPPSEDPAGVGSESVPYTNPTTPYRISDTLTPLKPILSCRAGFTRHSYTTSACGFGGARHALDPTYPRSVLLKKGATIPLDMTEENYINAYMAAGTSAKASYECRVTMDCRP